MSTKTVDGHIGRGEIEALLGKRGFTVTYQVVRQWCQNFGPDYARTLKKHQGHKPLTSERIVPRNYGPSLLIGVLIRSYILQGRGIPPVN